MSGSISRESISRLLILCPNIFRPLPVNVSIVFLPYNSPLPWRLGRSVSPQPNPCRVHGGLPHHCPHRFASPICRNRSDRSAAPSVMLLALVSMFRISVALRHRTAALREPPTDSVS